MNCPNLCDNIPSMINTVLFDFDGTLVDSEPNYAVSDCRTIAHFGGNLTIEEHKDYVGFGSRRFLQAMKDRFGIEASIEEMGQVQDDLYLELARINTPVFPVMADLLEELSRKGITMAVASSTSRELLEELLDQAGIASYFSLVLSAEEVEQGKPAPDVFLKAAELLGRNPENCLVVEDSINGAHAGVRAGMDTVVLVSPFLKDRLEEYPKQARLIKGGIGEFRTKDVISLVCEPNS